MRSTSKRYTEDFKNMLIEASMQNKKVYTKPIVNVTKKKEDTKTDEKNKGEVLRLKKENERGPK